jgi:regulator of protease activity HflC (stomatin/prohibitin superfamily)
VQLTVVYRFDDPQKAAVRSNFTIALNTGKWVEKPLDRIAGFWSQRVREPVRTALASIKLEDAVSGGIGTVQAAIIAALADDAEVAAMGLAVVGIAVSGVTPAPELVKAMETPTRESLQQKADQAVFERRALAVEKERAIKENELATQIELARRQDELIQRQNSNKIREAEGKAAAERMRVETEQALAALAAEGYGRDVRTRAQGDSEARRMLGESEAATETAKAHAWDNVRPEVMWAMAAQTMATKLQNIEHITITPDTFGPMLSKIIRGEKAS